MILAPRGGIMILKQFQRGVKTVKKTIIGFFVLALALCCALTQPVTAYAAEEHEHTFCMATLNKETTCTGDGEVCYTCAQCGESWTETIPSTGHLYDEGRIITEPTCSRNGVIAFTCANCDEIIEERLPKTDHRYDDGVVLREGNCEQTGLMVYTCRDCGDTVEEVLPGGTHTYDEEVTREPSCSAEGEIVYTCRYCGDSRVETIPMTGHLYGEGEVIKEPSCATNGKIRYTCALCGDSYTEIIEARGYHRVRETGVIKEPTCTTDGVRAYLCVDCGANIEKAIPMTGHNFESVDPETGRGTCTVCGHTEFVHDHQWGTWTVTKIATYTEPGEHKRVCPCGEEDVISLGCLQQTPEEVYLEVLRLVNIEREKAGVPPLTYKYDAQIAADARSLDLILEFDHSRPDGTRCYSVLDDYGIVHMGCMGENIAMGHQNPEEVMDGWMNSPGHRQNILRPDYTSIAIGGVGYRWVQLFFGG